MEEEVLIPRNRSTRFSTTKAQRTQAVLDKVQNGGNPNINGLSTFLAEDNVKAFNRSMIDRCFGNVRPAIENRDICIKECSEYFLLCDKYNMIPTIATLSLYLGVSHNKLYEYSANPNCEYRDVIQEAIQVCHSVNEMGALAGKIPVTLYQFLSTNYYGLKNTQQVEIKPTIDTTVDNQETLKIIEEQIANENM